MSSPSRHTRHGSPGAGTDDPSDDRGAPREGSWERAAGENTGAGQPTIGQPTAGDPRFYQRTGPHSLAAVVDAAGAEAPPRRLRFRGVAPLSVAEAEDVSFLDNRKYLSALEKTRAGAVIVHPDFAGRVPATAVPIVTAEVYVAWARVATLFHPPPPVRPGIHPTAVIGAGARIDPSAEIGPLAVIGDRVVIGRARAWRRSR